METRLLIYSFLAVDGSPQSQKVRKHTLQDPFSERRGGAGKSHCEIKSMNGVQRYILQKY